MLDGIRKWIEEANFTWKDLFIMLVISLALMWLTNHLTEHVCFCDLN
jgi:hypothetical protein